MNAPSNCLAILTYHSLDTSGSVISLAPQDFIQQMAYLAERKIRGTSLSEALAFRASRGMWPEQAVVLTFDDGYASFSEIALPVLLRHRFTATLFVASGHVGGINAWAPPPAAMGSRPMLSWSQIAEAAAAGIEIGAHTRTHPDLRRLDAAATEREIVGSRHDIEHHLQSPVTSFAYPFGIKTPAAAVIVRREFRAACTTVLKRAAQEAPHQLPRIDVYYLRTPRALPRLLNGRLDGTLRRRRWARALRRALAPAA